MTGEPATPNLQQPPDGGVINNPWESLRSLTTARIALGRAGLSQPTAHHLAFQLAHAQARDAVHSELDIGGLQSDLARIGQEAIVLHSQAEDRRIYLQRPDLGRRLDQPSVDFLTQRPAEATDVAFVIADGLSALAVERHAVPLLQIMLSRMAFGDVRIAPVTIVEQARVAISDEIGSLLHTEVVVILIGERPGLSSPDSLGVYLTYDPKVGNTDANRNCISNIHAAGLSYEVAADNLMHLIIEARRHQMSGVLLKGNSTSDRHLNNPEAPA